MIDNQTNKKSTTLDDLAAMIKNGFDNTATKQDLREVKTSLKSDIAKIDEKLQVVETKLDRALYTELTHIETRVKRLEERVGIKAV